MTSRRLIRSLLQRMLISKVDTVLEIDARNGNVTKALAEASGKVISYEIDTVLYRWLVMEKGAAKRFYGLAFRVPSMLS